MAGLLLCAAGGTLMAQRGQPASDSARTGTISGTVKDEHGAPVVGAHVEAGPAFAAVTDSSGRFALRGLPVGSVSLTVRRVGFAPLSSRWDLGAYTLTLDLRIQANPVALPVVRVQSKPQPYDARLAGFYERMHQKLGYYLTEKDFERGHSFVMTDALQRLPGVKPYTMPGALGTTVRLSGESCPPLVIVDGFPAALGHFDLDMIDLSTVEGIEVYPRGTSVPAALMGPYGMQNCGVIAIWSRPMRPNVRADQLPPEHPVNVDSLLQANVIYTPGSVDVPARYIAATAAPVYPDSLFKAGISGKVLARFVVDTSGDVEPATVSIVSASDSLFGAAVVAALRGARFQPARLRNAPVRQLVEMPFDFAPTKSDSTAGPQGMPGRGHPLPPAR
jgi:TonB family protein